MLLTFALAQTVSVVSMSVDAPINAVTVFSDRARVERTAKVSLTSGTRVEFPLLPDRLDPSTIRVTARGADVRRVDITRVEAEEFPRSEARALFEAIEKCDDQVTLLSEERQGVSALLDALGRLVPVAQPGTLQKAAPKLATAGWTQVFGFVEGWTDKLQTRVREVDEKLADLARERAWLVEKARAIGGARRQTGYRAVAVVEGHGDATLAVSYVVGPARWIPTYDIQLAPEKNEVRVAFAGLVSQETGEDWGRVMLTLSTAVPATTTLFPRLLSWRIGERERFIPTPTRVVKYFRPPPTARLEVSSEEREDEVLRVRLLQLAGSGRRLAGEEERVASETKAPEKPRYYPAPPPKSEYYSGKRAAAQPKPAPAREWSERTGYRGAVDTAPLALRRAPSEPSGLFSQVAPQQAIGIAPPAQYVRPTYAADLPASAAGGYDLLFPAARRETVNSGKEARRVALLSEKWPVQVERRVFPALASEAFLVAEIKSPSERVLPGGRANLFVGADPAGSAWLKLVAPTETFVLPLGIDRAIRPIRNVKMSTEEKGLFSKDELTEYAVTIEIANPYKTPIATRVIDQWPVTSAKETELKLLGTDPPVSEQDPVSGKLEWRITVPASGKSTVSFTYSLRRPKGWQLWQQ